MTALRHMTLGRLLHESAARYPDNPAVEYAGERISYRALLARAAAVAKGFLALGMRRGSHIAVWSTDRPNTLICFYGAALIGAVAVMPNTSLKQMEIGRLLADCNADLLLYGDGYKDVDFSKVVRGLPSLPKLQGRVYIGEAGQDGVPDLTFLIRRGASVTDAALAAAEAAVTPEDTATMLFTSGTVGASKGVMTSHFARVNNAISQAADLSASERDRFLVAIPMFHCFSMSANILAALTVGACLYFPENRRTQSILEGVALARCTVLHAVPTLLHALLARADLSEFDLSSLRIGLVGGSLPDRGQMQDFRERLGYELLPSLGLTEATGGITVAHPADPLDVKTDTVGRFMEHIEGRILDPATGKNCRPGQVGEICVRGYCVMQGYYGLPEMTHEAIDGDGFLHTGDLGALDAEGNVHFAGRRKEVVIRGGENIFPREIEDCIRTDPRVAEVRVIGVPDAHYGECVCACIVKAPGAHLTAEGVRRAVEDKLASYKKPEYVLFFDALPKGGSGKVALSALSQMAQRRIKEEKR